MGPANSKGRFLSTGWYREKVAVIKPQKIEKAVSLIGE